MTSLLDEAAELAPRVGGQCGVARLAASLAEPERSQVIELVESSYSAVAVATVFKRHHWDVGEYTVNRHRRGVCRCRA